MANEFDTLFAARKKGRNETPAAAKNPTEAKAAKKQAAPAPEPPAPEPIAEIADEPVPAAPPPAPKMAEPAATPKKKKRGRPATGKRSDDGWIGRTYYIQEKTDLDIAEELIALRRQGVSLDKSELVDALLSTWVRWRKGEDSESCLGEFSPRRKDS